ncbi:hypothetical protein [Flavobacterium sp. TBRC 19031]|uniref:hypothetical protein n=1 Tax=Flavobacterium mekongense TaxID=3379707 RepID=UPI00399B48D2
MADKNILVTKAAIKKNPEQYAFYFKGQLESCVSEKTALKSDLDVIAKRVNELSHENGSLASSLKTYTDKEKDAAQKARSNKVIVKICAVILLVGLIGLVFCPPANVWTKVLKVFIMSVALVALFFVRAIEEWKDSSKVILLGVAVIFLYAINELTETEGKNRVFEVLGFDNKNDLHSKPVEADSIKTLKDTVRGE